MPDKPLPRNRQEVPEPVERGDTLSLSDIEYETADNKKPAS